MTGRASVTVSPSISRTIAEHAVGRRVLRAHVDDEALLVERVAGAEETRPSRPPETV